jgi:hypothetical protein
MTEQIKIMLSSTISDMGADRDAIVKLFEKYPFVKLVGAKPIQQSVAYNPYLHTLNLAENCDFYILLLGERYGYEIRPGVSATEAEFDQVVKTNPSKVLVFKNTSVSPEVKQLKFINKVGDYFKGFWISEYAQTHKLQELVEESFLELLKERASIGKKLSNVDHFVRLAIQRFPTQDALVYYSVTKDIVDLTYEVHGTSHTVQFDRSAINRDFWGCISNLVEQFTHWA